MEFIDSEIIRIKEAAKLLREMKSLNQYHLLGALEGFIEDYEVNPSKEGAQNIEDIRYRKETTDSDTIFGSIFTQELTIYGTRTTLDRLLSKLRDAILRG